MKTKYSQRDTRGMLCVDCSECNRGGNGQDEDKCAAGARIKKGNKGACFSGELIHSLEVD